ncbi:hypothetical protein EXIGLDRAFT_718419 [Exidia glandulosa HHB12029]|uniref:NACHT domain-containing protein n=1 Tax=Exidia glandulosa HHB12029 TaxID=1314781 RepID=A0A165HQQ6_EXIGL|nr:hypothetical protein EXIGLDRAFT_718419 [Exidia glandulosa HHB12029]
MTIPFSVALAAQTAEVAGHEISRTLLGVAQIISESARIVRVNQQGCLSLARHVDELVAVVNTELEAQTPSSVEWEEGLQAFQIALESVREFLQDQTRRSYLSQIVHQDRDAAKLQDLREVVKSSFSVLQLTARFHLHELAEAATAPYEFSAALEELDALRLPSPASTSKLKAPIPAPPPRRAVAPLPPCPQLFFGRADETQSLVEALPGRHCILGPPGIGKTALALSVLHSPATVRRFGERRYFVPCDAADRIRDGGCLGVVAGAFGILSSSRAKLERELVTFLQGEGEETLVVLDNFESAWEHQHHSSTSASISASSSSQAEAESLLSLLTSLPNLSLLVTLRGSERPSTAWTRPFFPPLRPLSQDAARQAFLSIAGSEEPLDERLMEKLDGVPLALELMAYLAQFEPASTLLLRWDEQRTSMLRRGLTTLDASIALSVHSPRMTDGALKLLSLLALLPDGVVDSDVGLWAGHIPTYARALGTLQQTALVSRDEGQSQRRVRVLAPIREYIQLHHPPSLELVAPLLDHYFALIDLFKPCPNPATASEVARELRNTESILRYALSSGSSSSSSDPKRALEACVSFCRMVVQRGIGSTDILFSALSVARGDPGMEDLVGQLLYWWAYMASTTTVPGVLEDLLREAKGIFERTGNDAGVVDTSMHLLRFASVEEAVVDGERTLAFVRDKGLGERRAARTLQALARAHERLGNIAQARGAHEEAVRALLASEKPEMTLVGFSQARLAHYALTLDDPALGLRILAEQALPALEATSYTVGVGNAHHSLGSGLLLRGDAQEGIQQLQRALEIYRSGAYVRHQIETLCRIVEGHLAVDDVSAAEEALRQAASMIRSEDGTSYARAHVAHAQGLFALHRKDAQEARAALGSAWRAFRARDNLISPEIWTATGAETLLALGCVAQLERDEEEARNMFVVAALANRKVGWVTSSVVALAHLAETLGDEGERVLQAVMLPLLRFGYRPALARALLCSGEIARTRADVRLARRRMESALRRFEDMKDAGGISAARVGLERCTSVVM